jgi:hypothetical protein
MHSGVPLLPDRIRVEVPDGSKSITADFPFNIFRSNRPHPNRQRDHRQLGKYLNEWLHTSPALATFFWISSEKSRRLGQSCKRFCASCEKVPIFKP